MWTFRKFIFAVGFVLVLMAPSWAANPEEALSSRPEAVMYWSARIDDLSGTLRGIFSPANIEMFSSLVHPEEAQGIRIAASLASQIPAESLAFVMGLEENKEIPFVQMAISVPERLRPKLDLVARGEAKAEDVITLLLGEAALLFAREFALTTQEGPEGPYYILNENLPNLSPNLNQGPALSARDNLLLISFPPTELSASLAALENTGNRLAFKRRFKSSNYVLLHGDMGKIGLTQVDPEIDTQALRAYFKTHFKAPFEIEVAFDAKPGKFLISSGVNILEAFRDAERWKKIKPVPGAGMFLAGGGRQLLGLSSVSAFKADEWKVYPEFISIWEKFLGELGKRGITEKDIEDLLTGTVSVAVGGETAILGRRTPGLYVALNGQPGAAANIWDKILEDETFSQAIPLSPLKVEGWDSLFRVDPALLPVPLLLGVSKDTFFLGLTDFQKLGEKPEFTAEATEIFEKKLFTSGFFDLAKIWEYLRKEIFDPSSNLGILFAQGLKNNPAFAKAIKDVLDAELPVSSIKIWGPSLETGFIELSLVDVPQEKRLLPRLANLAMFANTRGSGSAEAVKIITNLRNLKAAAMMFYADNYENVQAGKIDAFINLDGSATVLLRKYIEKPETYAGYIFKSTGPDGKKKWIVGCDVSDKPSGVRQHLRGRAHEANLIDQSGNPYSGGDFVFMIVR